MELGEPRRIIRNRLRQELERDRLAEAEIVGPVHLAHAPFADGADHPVTPGQDGARQEPALVHDGARRQPA